MRRRLEHTLVDRLLDDVATRGLDPEFGGYDVRLSPDDALFSVRGAKVADVPASASSRASVLVGGTYSGVVDFAGDADWIKVSMVAGKTYVIDELGSQNAGPGTLYDPRLIGIYNSKAKLVAAGNDDWMGGLNAHVEFTPTVSGTYYISASAYGSYVGSYQVRVVEKDLVAPTLTSASPADEAVNVAVNSNLTFQFSEAIQLGQGAITINHGSDVYTVQSSEISISGNTLTINPISDFSGSTAYSVNFAYDSVKDISGNSFAGQSNYNFQTASATQPVSNGTWNIMVYMAADNNLESFALYNLNQIESVLLPANVKVTALVDRIAGYASTSGNWTDTRFGFIQHDSSSSVTSLSSPGAEKNMGDPATLRDFIVNASSLYPADHNMLIIWDHGGGLDGAAWDDTNGGDNLTIKEMSTAIAASGMHFDIIGFDACLMAMTEVAYSLAPYTNYLVGSQDLEPGNGWSYDQWLSLFKTNPNPTAELVADTAVSTYSVQYPSMSGITLSSIDTSYMQQLTNALKEFSDYAVTANATDLGLISSAARVAQGYPVDPGYSYNYGDLGDFMARVYGSAGASSTLKADALSVITILQAMVTSESGTVTAASGLSVYLPAGNDYVDPSYNVANYDFLAGVPNWDNMLALI